ncbi:MAG: tetratricopeptide repeat protein, partial [Nitrospirales bacterium]
MTPLLSKIRQFGLFLLLAYVCMGNASLQAGEAQDLLGQAFSAYQQQQWTSAIAPLERALVLYPGYAEAHHLLGLVLNNLEKSDKAIIELQRAVEAYPHFAQAYVDLGFLYQQQSQFQKAEQSFQLALKAYPKFVEARVALAGFY